MAQKLFADLTFEQVVQTFHQTVASVCIMRLNNHADAEDCFQNTFLKLYRTAPELNDKEHIKAWLIRVAINECNSYIRRNKRHIKFNDKTDGAVDFPYDRTDISWALVLLDDKYKDILYLHYVERYKINEIADILQININTAKTRLKRGREELKKIYGGDNR